MRYPVLTLAFALTLITAGFGQTPLPDAAMRGDIARVRALLRQHADVNAAQGDGMSALHWAAYRGNAPMVKELLAAGAKVSAVTHTGAITPLFLAAADGDPATLEALLQAGATVNSPNANGTTPLMMAAAAGSAERASVLLEHGAYVNAREFARGQTALMFAAARGRDDVIRLLMKHGADPGIITSIHEIGRVRIDPEGHFVAETPADIQAAKDLAKRNHPQGAAQIQATLDQSKLDLDRLGRALGLKSVEFRAGKAFTHPPPALNFDYIGPHFVGGMTALIYAAREGHLNAVAALLEGGADIDQVNSEKYTPLVIAITNGHLDLAGYLLNHGADPNLSTMTGLSPLYAVVDVQWAPHASYPQPNTEQEKTGYLDLMRALLDHGANPDAQVSDSLWFRSFISDRTWADPTGSTPFWRAAQASDIRAMRLLVDHGANPKTPTKAKVTPLMVAAGVGWAANWSVNAPDPAIEAVQYCVERGNDVNAADENHNTALHGAAFIGNNEIVKYLVDHGAKVDVKNGDGDSPADMANGPNRFAPPHPETVAMLEKLGSPNSHNCRSAQCIVDVKPKSEPGLSSAEQSNKDALEALAATLGLHSVIYRAGPSEPKAVSSSGH